MLDQLEKKEKEAQYTGKNRLRAAFFMWRINQQAGVMRAGLEFGGHAERCALTGTGGHGAERAGHSAQICASQWIVIKI